MITPTYDHGTMTAMAVALAYVYHALAPELPVDPPPEHDPEEAAASREERREEEAERKLKEEG